MRLLLIAVLLACVTVIPIIVVGAKNADGVYAENTYNKSLDYDKGKKAKTVIDWTEPECQGEVCSIVIPVNDLPDSLTVRVFRPTVAGELVLEQRDAHVNFRNTGEGWYIVKLDYEKDGVLVSDEKSFYIKKAV